MSNLGIYALLGVFLLGACQKANSKVDYKISKPRKDKIVGAGAGVNVSEQELMEGSESSFYKLEKELYDLKLSKIRTLMVEKIMKADPKGKGLTNDQYFDRFIGSQINIKAEDIEKFIVDKKIPKEHINPQIRQKIQEHLKSQQGEQALEKWLSGKLAGKPIEIFLEKPQPPVFRINTEDSPSLGNENAKVTIVEFSDFQCPFCARGAERIHELKKKYGNKVRFVFKHFPLPFHKHAEKASVASLCAHEQNKGAFWKMHDLMFENQSKLGEADLVEHGKTLGLDKEKFQACLSSMKYLSKVQKDMEEGKKLGINSTPTFFVNGKIINGAQPVSVFSELIEEDL